MWFNKITGKVYIGSAVLIKRVNDGLIYKDKYLFSREPFKG